MIGNKLEPFKFWCQKVLPNVYDDSLSYYEYLCKLNEYLNEVIGQINTLTDNMEDYEADLTATWLETKEYIDNYFNNLDVQQEINNKLDQMAQSGTLSTLLEPFVSQQIGGVVANQIGATVANQIGDTVASQIDSVVANQIDEPTATATNAWLTAHVDPVGSAVVVDNTLTITGAAADAKVTGDRIKTTNDILENVPEQIKNVLENGYESVDLFLERGGVNLVTGGDNDDQTDKFRTKGLISLGNRESVKIVPLKPSTVRVGYCYFNSSGVYQGYVSGIELSNGIATIDNDYPYYRFQFSHTNSSTVTSDEMDNIIIGTEFNVDYMKCYSALQDYFIKKDNGTLYNGLLGGGVGDEIEIDTAFATYHYCIISVSANEKYHIVANVNGIGQRPYYFTDNSNVIISRGTNGINGTPYIYEGDVEVPSDATKLYISYYGDTKCYAYKYSNITNGTFDIGYESNYTSKTGLATSISNWVPTVSEFPLYNYITIRSNPKSRYLIDGYCSGSGNRFIFEVSESGNYLRTIFSGEDGVYKHYKNIHTLSNDAYGIVICYRNDYYFNVQLLKPNNLAEHIYDINKSLNQINDKLTTPYKNKKIVFFGTSIPAGTVNIDGVPYSIPTYIGKLLGATIYNESVGESCARLGWENAKTENDPYGWTGHAWQNVFWAMGANLSEKNDLITNYQSKWYNLINDTYEPKPVSLTQDLINRINACSYVNKLVPYLDGTKAMPDLFVFEHGHNDIDYTDPTEISGIASNPNDINNLNRSLFGDVMAFYIRLIKQYNPQAKILIVSNYENDSDYYKNVFTSQKAVAETNKVWFCDVANVINWSAVKKMTTTGYWDNGIWVNSGGESRTITFLESAFPDKIHPFTDLSGKAVIREATIIATFIKSAGILDI